MIFPSPVRLSDPTCFSHVIEYVKRMAEDMRGGGGYAVLLIVTDGGVEGGITTH